MATPKKISELTTAGALTGAELVPVVQNGGTLQTTTADLKVFSLGTLEYQVSTLNLRVEAVSALATQNSENKANRIGDYLDDVQYIEFNTSTVINTSAGRASWNIDESTVDIGLDGAVVLHTGLQLYQRVYNNTGVPLPKGTVIRVTGSQGQRLTAAPALADGDANSATTFAVMAETVGNNSQGFALTEGVLKNIDTQGIADGTTLWLSPTAAGQFTSTKPVAPQHLVLIGFVVKGNSSGAGSIYVKIINGFELGELHDVRVSASTSLVNDEVLAYNTSAGVWTNSTLLITTRAEVSVNTAAITSINGRLPTGTIVDTTSVQTLTNKRINPRVSSTSTAVSVSPSLANHDMYFYTALQTAVSVNPPVGTPTNGNRLMFRFKDNGVSRAITWRTTGTDAYRAVGVTLPLATTINKVTYVGCLYNANESFWDVIAVATQA
jgi:hypothetical protein